MVKKLYAILNCVYKKKFDEIKTIFDQSERFCMSFNNILYSLYEENPDKF